MLQLFTASSLSHTYKGQSYPQGGVLIGWNVYCSKDWWSVENNNHIPNFYFTVLFTRISLWELYQWYANSFLCSCFTNINLNLQSKTHRCFFFFKLLLRYIRFIKLNTAHYFNISPHISFHRHIRYFTILKIYTMKINTTLHLSIADQGHTVRKVEVTFTPPRGFT